MEEEELLESQEIQDKNGQSNNRAKAAYILCILELSIVNNSIGYRYSCNTRRIQ